MSAFDNETAAALREAGYNPDRYTPINTSLASPAESLAETNTTEPTPVEPVDPSFTESADLWAIGHGTKPETPATRNPGPEELSLQDDVRAFGYYKRQIDYAIRQKNPAEQINLYALTDNFPSMIGVAEKYNPLSDEELENMAQFINVPPKLAELLHDEYPDEFEKRKLYAKMITVAGSDSYIAARFSHDPKYAAVNRKHIMALADLQAALNNVYASNTEILGGKFQSSIRSLFTETAYGIPADLAQESNELLHLPPLEPMEETPIPEGLRESDPRLFMEMQSRNRSIQEYNERLRFADTYLGSEPKEINATRERMRAGAAEIADWTNEHYQDALAETYAGHTETGNWWLDVPVSTAIQALPSIGISIIEAAVSGGIVPLIHFGLLAKARLNREMRAAGVDPQTSSIMSTFGGFAEGILEKFNANFLIRGSGFRNLARRVTGPTVSLGSRVARVGGHMITGGMENAAQEKAQEVSGNVLVALSKLFSLGNQYSNVLTALVEGVKINGEDLGNVFAGMLGAGAAGREFSEMQQYNKFQKTLQPLIAAGDAAIKSGKSIGEARQEVRNMGHIAAARSDGKLGTTFFADAGDVESYLQSKPKEEAEKALASIGVTPEDYRQAQAEHIDIEVPIEHVAVQEGGSDPKLVKLFRPTPSMATASAIARRTQEAASLFDLARTLRDEIQADVNGTVVPEAIRTLRQDLTTRLNYRAQEADFTASLVWAWARTTAERRGIDFDKFLTESGNIRTGLDAWIQQNEAWLEGVRGKTPITEMEETSNETDNESAFFDPALGEGQMDIPEQPSDGIGELPGTESGPTAQSVDTGSGEPVGSPVRIPATEQTGALFSPAAGSIQPGEYADKLTGLPYAMETVSTEGVKTDPGALQFKRNADPETGVKKGAEIPGDVNPAALGTMVFYEDVDGNRFVVSGHHRLDLLRRKGEDTEVRAVVLRESDGWSTDHARLYGAAINIIDGGGDVDDYATFFRETRGRLSREEAEKQGLFRGERARTGYAIGALGSDNVFFGFLNEELSAREAAGIANAAPGDPAIQDLMIERKTPIKEMETFAGYVKKLQNSGALNLDGVQLSLFAGQDHSAMLAAMERESKAAAKQATELDKKASGLENLMKVGKTISTADLRKHGARAGDREGLRQEAAELRAEAERWRKFYQNPDILAQVQERAGTTVESFSQSLFRSPFYRQEDLAALQGKSGEIVDAVLPEWSGDRKELRRWALAELMEHREEPVVNRDTGWNIVVNRRGAEKSVNEPRKDVELLAIGKIPELLKRAIKGGVSDYDKGNMNLKERGIKGYHRFYAPLLVDGKDLYAVQLTVKERFEDGYSFYLHRMEISDPAAVDVKAEGEAPTITGPARSQYSIPDLLKNVKDGGPETFDQGKRGEVQLYRADATHRQAAVIRVMKGGDMSTVLHELAHIFLADMRDYVGAGGADVGTVRDYGKLLHAAGDLTQADNVEQVVRWFEEYLREGKAPSVELVKPFGLFSKWLTNVYNNVRQYVGQEMDVETRGVFDRWLASEREIAEAEAYYGGLYSSNFINLIDDDEEKEKLAEQLEQKRQRILNRHAGQMAKAWSEANVNRDKMADAAEKEAMKQPVYRAIAAAKVSGMDKATAEKTVGKATVLRIIDIHGDIFAKDIKPLDLKKALRKLGYTEQEPVAAFLKELSEVATVEEAVKTQGSHGRKKRYYEALEMVAKAGGIDPAILSEADTDMLAGLEKHSGLFQVDGRENLDRIAMESGFKTPSAMLDTMAKTPDMETVVKRMTERMVRAEAKKARAWAEESLVGVMDDTSPAGQSALHDPNEDAMAEGIEIQREALRKALEAKTRRRASYLGRRVLEDRAKRNLYSKSLREAMSYNNYANTERYWSGVAAEAMAKGDKEKALTALDNQQKYHAMATEAFRIRRDFTDFMRRYGQRMAQSELASVHDAYRDAARDILVFTGVVVDKSGRFAPANSDPDHLILPQALRDEFDLTKNGDPDTTIDPFHASMETLIPQWIREKRLSKGFMGNILDLTPDMMADIDASIKTLIKYGREELTALRDKDNQYISDLRDKLLATMKTLPDKRRLGDKRMRDKLQSDWDSYLSGNLSIDVLAEEVDGFVMHLGKEMGLMQILVKKIRDGEVKQSIVLDQFHDATAADFQAIDGLLTRLKKENGTFFNLDGVRSPSELTDGASPDTEWDREMILSLMFNVGNKGNLYALQKGYGLTDTELNRLTSLATEKEWLAVQHIAQEMGSLFDELDAVHYRLTNRHLEKVQLDKLTVMTADGKIVEMDEWYYPLVFDPKLNDAVGKNAEASDYRAVMNAIFNPQKLKDGFTHSRQVDEDGNPVVTYPPLLSTRVIIDHMTTGTRWMTLAEPLMEFRRVTMDPDFKKLFTQKLGADRYRDLRMWTNRMARPDKGADESWNKLIRKLKNASTVASLGVNLRSAVRQLSSGGLAADTMSKASRTKANGWYYMWRGLRKMGFQGSFSRLLSPLGLKSAATEEMFRLSPEAKFRAENVNKDIRDALDKFRPTSGKVSRAWRQTRNALFHFTIASDHLVSGAAWWGAFEQASTGNAGFETKGLSQDEIQAKAADYANYVVRTQQSPYQVDYTRLQADNGPISLMTQFMGGLTPYLNNTYINVQLTRRLGWRHATPLARHILNAYVIPSVALIMLMREAWSALTGDDEDDEEHTLAWELAEEISGQAVGGLPGIRDGVRWGIRTVRTGRNDVGAVAPPAIAYLPRIGYRGYLSAKELLDGDAYAAGKDAGMAAAEILGVAAPIRQLKPLAEEWDLVESN